MIDAISAVIDSVRDPAARPRLRRCIPWLRSAVEGVVGSAAHNGVGGSTTPDGSLKIACATARGATVLSAADWPSLPASTLKSGEVASALLKAVESDDMRDGDVIVAALALLLGRTGIEAQRLDADLIREGGEDPLVVALLEREGATVTLLISTIALPAAVAATLH